MKQIISLLMIAILVLSLSACNSSSNENTSNSSPEEPSSFIGDTNTESKAQGENPEEDNYNENVSFSLTSYNTITGVDYTNDDLYKYISEKFNIDVEVWSCEASAADEKQRMWINGGTMPDVMKWDNFDLHEYYSYVDQGLLHPLPDGWETTYPNISKLVSASGIADLLKVDGKTYGIPCSIFGNNLTFDVCPGHTSLYFRRDWADQVGLADLGDENKVSISELRNYLEKVKEEGLCENATLGCDLGNMVNLFFWGHGIDTNAFIDTGSEWIWGPQQEKIPDVIATMRSWYQEGLLDPDFYTGEDLEYRSAFSAGQTAAIYTAGNANGIATFRRDYEKAFEGSDAYKDIAVACLTADDGMSYIPEVGNYWTVNVFNPETDEKTIARILDLIDWIAGDEGQAATQLGVPDQDWHFDENGVPVVDNEVKYPSVDAFYLLGYCLDDFQMSGVDPAVGKQDLDECLAIYSIKGEGTIFPIPWDFVNNTSTAVSNYSVDWTSKISELVVGTDDIETSWTNFIEENRGIWEPVLEELNKESGF